MNIHSKIISASLCLTLLFSSTAHAAVVSIDKAHAPNPVRNTGYTGNSEISADGRFVVFEAANHPAFVFDPSDTNILLDIYLFDKQTKALDYVSTSSTGVVGDAPSLDPTLSDDGNLAAFWSPATNLVLNDTNSMPDAFVKNRTTRELKRVNGLAGVEPNGPTLYPHLSGNGQYVAVQSSASNMIAGGTFQTHIYLQDTQTGVNELISKDSSGVPGNGVSETPFVSESGQYVAFVSSSDNLVPGDANNRKDIFLFNRGDNSVRRVSVSSLGVEANDDSSVPSVSRDGRFVAFQSNATNLVIGQINPAIYVYDTLNNTIELIPGSDSSTRVSLSPDGNFVAFESGGSVLLYDRVGAVSKNITTNNLTGAVGSGEKPDVADNGAFVSMNATGAGIMGSPIFHPFTQAGEVFIYDNVNDSREIASAFYPDGGNLDSTNPSFSENGRRVAFQSASENFTLFDPNTLTDIFLYDADTQSMRHVSADRVNPGNTYGISGGPSANAAISPDGNFVAFESQAANLVLNDTNGQKDIFLYNDLTQTTIRVSVDSLGNESDGASQFPAASNNGEYVVYASSATNLIANDTNGVDDIFLHNTLTGTTERISVDSLGNQSNGASTHPHISKDGRYIIYQSGATNLVPNDTNGVDDIFLYDRNTTLTTRLSVDSSGAESNGHSSFAKISLDGSKVVFISDATNLIANDTNAAADIFVHTIASGITERASVATGGTEANGASEQAHLSSDGRYVVFTSNANNLVANDINGQKDVFLRDLNSQTTERISTSAASSEANNNSDLPFISQDGKYAGFASFATNLISGDRNRAADVFFAELEHADVNFNTTTATVDEDDGVIQLQITVSGGTLLTDKTVQIAQTGGTATNGVDYTFTSPVTITIPAGNYTVPQTINTPLTLLTDNTVEGNETAVFMLQAPASSITIGTNTIFTLTIQDIVPVIPPTPPIILSGGGGSGGGYTMPNSNTNKPDSNQNQNIINTNNNTPLTPEKNNNSNTTPRPSASERPSADTPVGRFNIPFKDTICYPMKSQNTSIAQSITQEDLKVFVENLLKKGVAFQKDGETFDPAASVNRSEMLRYIIQSNCEDFRQFAEFPAPFPDVSISHTDALFVYLAKLRNIVRGYIHDGTFKPDNSISRAEALKVVLEMTLSDGTFKFSGTAEPFTDVNWKDENTWYKNYLSFAVEKGIITIPESKLFRPNDKALKSEIIFMLARSLQVKNM